MSTNAPHLAQDFIHIHKIITRSLQVGQSKGEEFLSSGFTSPKELVGYSNYIHCFVKVLGAHHTGEDSIAFPAFRTVLPNAPYGRLSIDHQQVEMLLVKLPKPIDDLAGNKPEAGLKAIVETIVKISEMWYPHIQIEEENFAEEKLNAVLSPEEQKNIGDASSKHSQKLSEPPYWVLPFVLYNLDRAERTEFSANLPPAVVNELVPVVWKDQWDPMKPFLLD